MAAGQEHLSILFEPVNHTLVKVLGESPLWYRAVSYTHLRAHET